MKKKDWELEGISISVERLGKRLKVEAIDKKGKPCGYAHFVEGSDFLEADDSGGSDSLYVAENYRRMGLAQSMYDLAEKSSKLPLIPSEDLSGSGAEFWVARLKSLPADHPAHEWYCG